MVYDSLQSSKPVARTLSMFNSSDGCKFHFSIYQFFFLSPHHYLGQLINHLSCQTVPQKPGLLFYCPYLLIALQPGSVLNVLVCIILPNTVNRRFHSKAMNMCTIDKTRISVFTYPHTFFPLSIMTFKTTDHFT